MNAEPAVQLRLLDLQALDARLDQIEHRRRTLPQLAQIAELRGAVRRGPRPRRRGGDRGQRPRARDGEGRDRRRAGAPARGQGPGALLGPGRVGQGAREPPAGGGVARPPPVRPRGCRARGDGEARGRPFRARHGHRRARRHRGRDRPAEGRAGHRVGRRGPRHGVGGVRAREGAAGHPRRPRSRSTTSCAPTTTASVRPRCTSVGARAAAWSSTPTDIGRIRDAAPDEVLRCEECRRILVRTPESGL